MKTKKEKYKKEWKKRKDKKEWKERRQREEKEYEFEIRKLEFKVKLGSDPSVEKSSAKFDVTKHTLRGPCSTRIRHHASKFCRIEIKTKDYKSIQQHIFISFSVSGKKLFVSPMFYFIFTGNFPQHP